MLVDRQKCQREFGPAGLLYEYGEDGSSSVRA